MILSLCVNNCVVCRISMWLTDRFFWVMCVIDAVCCSVCWLIGTRRGLEQLGSHRHLVCQVCSQLMLRSPRTKNTQHTVCLSVFSLSYVTACKPRLSKNRFVFFLSSPFFFRLLNPVYIQRQCCLESFPWQRTVDRQHPCKGRFRCVFLHWGE